MTNIMTVACVQNCAKDDLDANLAELDSLIAEAARKGATFVSLPEACEFLSNDSAAMMAHAQKAEDHRAYRHLAAKAAEFNTQLLIGSLTMRNDSGQMVNRSSLINAQGEPTAFYDKIHMFDANVEGTRKGNESDLYEPGTKACVTPISGASLGLSICYDIRFPHLYRAMAKAGATMFAAPAAFMQATGEAGHWEVCLRARAIENGCFMVAPAQFGNHYDDRHSYGHSMIIAPWGEILADAGTGVGVVTATIDMADVIAARSMIMSLDHDRPFEVKAVVG